MNEREKRTLKVAYETCEAIVETVNKAPMGVPCGPLYMALMHVWPNLTSAGFNEFVDLLVKTGKVRRVGHCLYAPHDDALFDHAPTTGL